MESPEESSISFDEVAPFRTPGGLFDFPGIFTPGIPASFLLNHQGIEVDVSPASLARFFRAVQSSLMQGKDIHNFIADPSLVPDGASARRSVLRTYMSLLDRLSCPLPLSSSALFASAGREKEVSIMIAFGGQSASNAACVDDLAELYSLYQSLAEPLIASIHTLLDSLSHHVDTKAFFLGREIDLLAWLADPTRRPASKAFLAAAAISFPIIGLTGLLHYYIICKLLGKTPGEVGELLSCGGVTGHSQGIVVAAAVAKSDSWESFLVEARWAVELLFWMGYRSQTAAPQLPISPAMVSDSVENGDGVPSHMLLVRGMHRQQLEDTMARVSNRHLPEQEHIHLALINNSRNHVVAGPPRSLRGLVLGLRGVRAVDGLDQSRVPYSKRKPTISTQFLPINAPFHSPHLSMAAAEVIARMSSSWPESPTVGSLRAPVFYTENGADIREAFESNMNLTQVLVDAVMTNIVDWPKTLQLDRQDKVPTHIIALGATGFSGMIQRNVDGYGTFVIDWGLLDAGEASAIVGCKADIFAQSLPQAKLSPTTWAERFRPRLSRSVPDGPYRVETRLNRILKSPPIFVAGMTPTTVPWDFVASVIRAGYHIELAGGGYRTPEAMTAAIEKVAANIPVGRGISCNIIYIDPKAVGFQIPLLRQLIRRGVPIEGLTIGAGIPSPDVASEYIQTIGIKHISFKPGSARAIREVIDIAKRNPSFPVILQWTGGRAGGHHSCEDFHEPLLETYAEMRRCENLYLVVGSGFGDGPGMFPYLTGSWSLEFGRPAMPCDGILLGSRMMVATDAHTSPGARKLLLNAPGVDAEQWERAYLRGDAAGGVVTVTSEMGQPIHKLATRGVHLWKDMDDTIFSLPNAERQAALLKRKDEIIRRLNADFAKPWFGQKHNGSPADVQDMTYAEVLTRLVQLMYVHHQSRWIDPSYRELVNEFAIRSFERLQDGSDTTAVFDPAWLSTSNPECLVHDMTKACPDLAIQLLHPEDTRAFIQSCKKRGRKPVNFVVALDEDFEHWFKKDSLWQSEDLEAVQDQDPERVCILQSPVSVRYITRDDQSSAEILDEIHTHLVSFPSLSDASFSDVSCDSVKIDSLADRIVFGPTSAKDLPSQDDWLGCIFPHLSRRRDSAILALISEENLFEAASKRRRSNPFRHIFGRPHPGYSLVLRREDGHYREASLRLDDTDEAVVHVEVCSPKHLEVEFVHKDSAGSTTLALQWEFDEHTGRQLIDRTESRDQRIRDFYSRLWLAADSPSQQAATAAKNKTDQPTAEFIGPASFVLTQDLQSSLQSVVSHAFPNSPASTGQTNVLPLESAVIAAWDVLMRPLLLGNHLSGDILRLVHRSISIAYAPEASPMRIGESVTTESSIQSVTIEPSGKSIAVEARLLRPDDHRIVATVTSEFFIKGSFSNQQHPSTRHTEEPLIELSVSTHIDEAVLRDRSWLQLDDTSLSLVGKTLVFKLHSHSQWATAATTNLTVSGTVEHRLWNGSSRRVGSVAFEAPHCHDNPVLEFLQRKGRALDGKVPLKNPGWSGTSETVVVAPSHTELYAQVSGDRNPIHVSPVFAELAELPGPIMHGMYTAAVCRRVVEDLVIPGEGERMKRFDASFVGMVMPGDRLVVGVSHVSMKNGLMVFEVVARQEGESGEEVLRGEAEVDQPKTAYLFTGQGSQSKGMGMALYESSPVAKAVYDEMDQHLRDLYGWSILEIIRENPKEVTVHFRGRRGQKILQNYLAMKSDTTASDGQRRFVPIIPDLSPSSTSYTFYESRGLLHATQFAQPAIILLEKATLEHMRSGGLVQEGSTFAGHSLGEYGALSSMAGFVDFKDMLSIGFYRGLMMQFAIPRDEYGQTGYAMMATNPGRVGKFFDDQALRTLVRWLAQESGELLEIVNFNIQGDQYVCAGHVQNLHCLTDILNAIAAQAIPWPSAEELSTTTTTTTVFRDILAQYVARSKKLPLDVELRRGKATIPLSGIDVPFHSSRLRAGIPTFRKFFHERVRCEDIRPERLIGRFIPNVVGKPFSLDRAFIQEAADVTQSPVLLEGLGVVKSAA
ncbi:acyl transferase domain-containing protein [Bombardia bombarda]|uniref:Acyl transferase domain-containing protein n=1 Tax=Bombardia bombarda TaxID=252184 RepID=A0AA40C855_9PEZI|nr:acyl transferase domain-containing protein [Bombardia bombarda]